MIAQELLGLVQQLSFVFRTGAEITPPQLLQDLAPCRLTHALIHFRHGNSHFWHNVSIPLSLPPSSGNKTFGAMRNDGKRDLYIACGHLQDNVELWDDTTSYEAKNILLENTGHGKFIDVSARSGDGLAVKRSSRGAAFDD